MSIIAWVVLGAAAGWIASMIVGTDREQGWLMNIVLGIIGALVGGFLMDFIVNGEFELSFFSLWTWIAAIGGGILVSWAYSAMTGRRTA